MTDSIPDAINRIDHGLNELGLAMEDADWFQAEGELSEMIDLLTNIKEMYERSRSTGVEEGK